MPTTPSWNPGSNTHRAGGASKSPLTPSVSSDSAIRKAWSRMPPSISRRSRLMPSSSAGQFVRAAGVVGQQAFDAQRHVRQAPGGVDARAQGKAEVEGGGSIRLARSGGEQRGHARRQGAGTHALEALRDEAAVVGVELHHVGHGAQSDQRQQGVELGLAGGVEHAALAQFGAQRQQHVEHHADAGDGFALEGAAGLVRVDDDVGQTGSSAAGRWWSVTSTCRPSARASATPSMLAMPLSTVISTSAPLSLTRFAIGGVRP